MIALASATGQARTYAAADSAAASGAEAAGGADAIAELAPLALAAF